MLLTHHDISVKGGSERSDINQICRISATSIFMLKQVLKQVSDLPMHDCVDCNKLKVDGLVCM